MVSGWFLAGGVGRLTRVAGIQFDAMNWKKRKGRKGKKRVNLHHFGEQIGRKNWEKKRAWESFKESRKREEGGTSRYTGI